MWKREKSGGRRKLASRETLAESGGMCFLHCSLVAVAFKARVAVNDAASYE
jgi:hypothetical protein